MPYQFANFFINSALILDIINISILLIISKKLQKQFISIFFYLLIYAIISIWSFTLFNQGKNNLPLLHIYTILEFITLSFFYQTLLKNKSFFGKGFKIFMSLIVTILIANSIFLESIYGFNSNAKALVQITLIGYAIYYFFSVFGKVDFSKPTNQADLLVNFAILLYYSGSLFIFMFMKMLIQQNVLREQTIGFWFFHSLLLVIFQLLILVAVLKKIFTSKRPSE